MTWIHGTVRSPPERAFDVTVMTGDVSQFLVSENEWASALRALWRALVRGGRLALHAYDPGARIWERWNAKDSRRHVTLQDGTTVLIWTEVTGLCDDMVSFSHHYCFPGVKSSGAPPALRFWSEPRLRQSVTNAGFAIERVHGGWRGEPVGSGDGELIFVARQWPYALPAERLFDSAGRLVDPATQKQLQSGPHLQIGFISSPARHASIPTTSSRRLS